MNVLCHIVSLCKDVLMLMMFGIVIKCVQMLQIHYTKFINNCFGVYILNLVYNIVIFNEFSHYLLYNSSHSSCYSAGYAMCVCVSFGACVYRSLATAPTPHNTNRKHNIHHIPTQTHNMLQHSKAKKHYF